VGRDACNRGKRGRDGPFRSAPAQKARPVPVTIPTRRDGSSSSHFQTASSSWWPAMLMQLRELGRLSVTRRMVGVGKVRRACSQVGGGVVKGCDIAVNCSIIYQVMNPQGKECRGAGY